jgi:hypothetical protein
LISKDRDRQRMPSFGTGQQLEDLLSVCALCHMGTSYKGVQELPHSSTDVVACTPGIPQQLGAGSWKMPAGACSMNAREARAGGAGHIIFWGPWI